MARAVYVGLAIRSHHHHHAIRSHLAATRTRFGTAISFGVLPGEPLKQEHDMALLVAERGR